MSPDTQTSSPYFAPSPQGQSTWASSLPAVRTTVLRRGTPRPRRLRPGASQPRTRRSMHPPPSPAAPRTSNYGYLPFCLLSSISCICGYNVRSSLPPGSKYQPSSSFARSQRETFTQMLNSLRRKKPELEVLQARVQFLVESIGNDNLLLALNTKLLHASAGSIACG